MNQIIKRPRAKADLKEIWYYIADDSRSRADAFLRQLNTKIQSLANNPYLGRKRDELMEGLRSFNVGNYVIFYFPQESGVEVVRILHGARDIEDIFLSEQ